MLLLSSFSVIDAKGGEVVGTKAMKCYQTPNTTNEMLSNTKHPQFKFLILQVVLAFWSKISHCGDKHAS
jgi:hypothetical protein